jgi:hypothetical protein
MSLTEFMGDWINQIALQKEILLKLFIMTIFQKSQKYLNIIEFI